MFFTCFNTNGTVSRETKDAKYCQDKIDQKKPKKSLLKRKERKMGSEIGLGLVLVGLGLEMLIGISARDLVSANEYNPHSNT